MRLWLCMANLLSTPSLGITSLSRQTCPGGAFQLPLSGSRTYTSAIRSRGCISTLSTPSLGITNSKLPPRTLEKCRRFQLPLSGSLGIGASNLYAPSLTSFQLPLSGSRTYTSAIRSRGCISTLSTPSLGITNSKLPPRTLEKCRRFQLPLSGSLGIGASNLYAPSLTSFQLPLSGSL